MQEQMTIHFPGTEGSRKTFYPTPEKLAEQMLSGIDWLTVDSVLEPSAGKGDLAQKVFEKWRNKASYRYAYDAKISACNIDCIEIDPDLRSILKGKGFRVVHNDFLTYQTHKRYSVIIMNPPFDHGADHLLKALQMQEKGGAVICLLNAETIKNPYTKTRQVLTRELERLGAEITYIIGAFATAQRASDIEVALIKAVIPHQENQDSVILEKLHKDAAAARCESGEDENQRSDLAKGDFREAIIDSFNFEVAAGVRLIEEYSALRPYLKSSLLEKSISSPIMELVMHWFNGRNGATASVNIYIQETRKKYWEALFQNPKFTANLTSNLQQDLNAMVEKLADYDFSMFNIMELQVEMSKKVIGGIKDTIIRLFDDWTSKYTWDEYSKNVHFFDGWKTNNAFAVNKRVIIPFYSSVYEFGRYSPTNYMVKRALIDIEKVFDFLDGQLTTETELDAALGAAKASGQTKKIRLKYFMVTFYQKGTCHIEFTNLDVLQKFNLFAAREKNWLPPSYGRKRYQDMNREERAVIDSFEGEASYQRVLDRREYFLQEIRPAGLTGGDGV